MAQLNKTFQIQGYHPYSALKKVEETCKALESRYLGETVRWGPFASKSIKAIEDALEHSRSILIIQEVAEVLVSTLQNKQSKMPYDL